MRWRRFPHSALFFFILALSKTDKMKPDWTRSNRSSCKGTADSDSSSAALTSCLQKGHILVKSMQHSLSFPHHFCTSLTFLCTPCLHVQMHVANTGTCGKLLLSFTHVNVWRRVSYWVNFQGLELINIFYFKTRNCKIVVPFNPCIIYGPQSVYCTVCPKVFTCMVHMFPFMFCSLTHMAIITYAINY